MFHSDEDIVKYSQAREEILGDLTSAEDAATKNARLQNKLLLFHGNSDVIGLVHFNWGHSAKKLPSLSEHWHRSHAT